jgi:NAD(P)-dependent dehydrogenase (short-subunit alcohol dehydrogenase family)
MDIAEFGMGFFSLADKTAIVTGGNSGLGQAFSLALAKAGAHVMVPSLADDLDPKSPTSTRSLVEAEGVRYEFMEADITQPGVPAQVIAECSSRLGSVDILVNSAGICPLGEVLEFGRDKWDATVSVNLTAAFEMSHEAAKVMIPQRSGKIINICSMFSLPGRAPGRRPTRPPSTASPGSPRRIADELADATASRSTASRPATTRRRSRPTTRSDPKRTAAARCWSTSRPTGGASPADLMGTVVFLASKRVRLRQRPPAGRRRRLPGALSTDGTGGGDVTTGAEQHQGPYLVGIDCGSQSAKVVVYDAAGRRGRARSAAVLRPMLPTRSHGVALHPDDDLWSATVGREPSVRWGRSTAAGGGVTDIAGVGLCPIRCCKAFLAADGSAGGAGDELDGRARLPGPGCPTSARAGVRHHRVGLPGAPVHRPVRATPRRTTS